MNGIVLLMLMASAAQVGAPGGTERDFGWEFDKEDGVLQYIVQISPQEVQLMQQKSVAFPLGQENLSDIPPELVGRATRVVVRIGEAVLPRTPSLQELERMPRSGDPVNPSSTAMLGPGRISDVEPGVFNIQGNPQLSLPNLPEGFGGNSTSSSTGNLIDDASRASANSLRDGLSDALSSAASSLPQSPDASMLAQNSANALNQSGSAFLQGAAGGNSKFNNTGTPNTPALPNTTSNAGLPSASNTAAAAQQRDPSTWPQTNSSTGAAATGTSLPGYPANPQLNVPSLGQYSNPLPQQQTPTPGFGSSPAYTSRQNAPNTAASSSTYNQPGMSPLNNLDPQSNTYTGANTASGYPNQLNPGLLQNQFQQSVATGNGQYATGTPSGLASPYAQGTGGQTSDFPRIAANPTGNVQQSQTPPTGTKTVSTDYPPNESSPLAGNVDGILQVFFLLSLVVNFYLGILIRKLLARYRSLLMNVRSQAV